MILLIIVIIKKAMLRHESDSGPTASGITDRVHNCYDNEFESHRNRRSSNHLLNGYICREKFEKDYWRKLVTDQSVITLLEHQIVTTAVVTVRDSSGTAGFP